MILIGVNIVSPTWILGTCWMWKASSEYETIGALDTVKLVSLSIFTTVKNSFPIRMVFPFDNCALKEVPTPITLVWEVSIETVPPSKGVGCSCAALEEAAVLRVRLVSLSIVKTVWTSPFSRSLFPIASSVKKSVSVPTSWSDVSVISTEPVICLKKVYTLEYSTCSCYML